MYIPSIKASESLFSYVFRLASVNHYMTEPFFHKFILLKNGNFVAQKKSADSLSKLIGEFHSVRYEEITKRALSAPYSQRISNSDTCYYDEKHDKSVRYCPECIAEQHLNYGHGWLKREWLFNFQCSIHNKRLLKLVDTAKKRELSLFKAFESILRDVPSIGHKDLLESSDFESRPCIIAPCLLIDFFRSTAKRGLFDFDELEEPLHRLIGLFYQYLNCFPSDEKVLFADYLRGNVVMKPKDGMCFYKSSSPCLGCNYSECCQHADLHSSGNYNSINDADIKSIVEWVFQPSDLPEHISDETLQAYLKLKEHLVDYHDPETFEAATVKWLMILMESTYGSHTELFGVTFESIKREPISGLLAIQLKRKRVRSTNRFFLLPRVFEDRIKWYAEQRCAGRFRLADPVIMSRTGKPLAVSELNKILREPFSQQGGIPSEGQNLHAIRDVIAALAVASGANIQYLTKASGHSNTSLVRKNVLPV
ncbi:TniQ family protein [Vibrio sp. 10N.222.55.A1]|uniref:TniQ family protein n=1 Tax=Vibrio sp. 10N.222.55.A1 TaxID=3229646 RepID=UPI00354D48A6